MSSKGSATIQQLKFDISLDRLHIPVEHKPLVCRKHRAAECRVDEIELRYPWDGFKKTIKYHGNLRGPPYQCEHGDHEDLCQITAHVKHGIHSLIADSRYLLIH